MPTLYTHVSKNIFRTWLLMGLFFVFIIALGWVFAQNFGDPIILYIAVGFSFFMNVLSYWFSDKIALAVNKAYFVNHEQNPEIYHIVENLCITAGLPLPKIYIIDEPAINAFATGRNKEHASIALTRGAIEKLNRSELEGIISHELSHIGNKDIFLSTVVVVLVGFIALISHWFLRFSFFGGGRRSRDGNGANYLALIGIIFAILSPLAATLIQLAVSRKREYLADADGALLTRYPEGLASALEKIAADQNRLPAANDATAHLYIANPFKGKKISGLFSTHPPIEERIKILRGMSI